MRAVLNAAWRVLSSPLMWQVRRPFTALGLPSPIHSHFKLSCRHTEWKNIFIELAPDCKVNCHQARNFFSGLRPVGFSWSAGMPDFRPSSLCNAFMYSHTKVNEAFTCVNNTIKSNKQHQTTLRLQDHTRLNPCIWNENETETPKHFKCVVFSKTQTLAPQNNTKVTEYANHTHAVNI